MKFALLSIAALAAAMLLAVEDGFPADCAALLAQSDSESGDVAPSPDSAGPVSIRCGFPLAAHRIVDVTGDGGVEILAVGEAGEVRVWRPNGIEAPPAAGSLVLKDPARTLLAVGAMADEDERPRLAVLSPQGLILYRAGEDGGFSDAGTAVAGRVKFRLRVGLPQFAAILPDVNGDGRTDLLIPGADTCEIWINDGMEPASGDDAPETGEAAEADGTVEAAAPAPRFRRTAAVRTDVRRERTTSGEKLSDRLQSAFWIPSIDFEDVNGDGRPDVVVVDDQAREFHIQKKDGSIPAEPDVRLDLTIFRDTTPEASLRPGKTLAGGDDALLQMQDLDNDGIPDYVISHRRKLWVFHGTEAGPQFTDPTAILKVAEDVTALLVVPLDEDAYPDLLLLRVQVPAVAALLKGLFTELDVDISATGYSGKEGRTFSGAPDWKGRISVRLPKILGIIRNPEALIRKFEDTASKFRESVTGDFDGDGVEDVAMVAENGSRLDVWKGVEADAGAFDPSGLRNLFFEEENRVWTIDRILVWLGGIAERRAARITQGRDPAATIPLRADGSCERIAVETADLDGSGRSDLVVVYRDNGNGGEGIFDIHGVPGGR
jgi:hypothetical protein